MAPSQQTSSTTATGKRWWSGVRLLRQPVPASLLASNTLTSLGSGMQLLVQGWLAIALGGPWLLAAFAACRLAPKILLTLPAGIVSDRVPRSRILRASRWCNVAASLVALGVFVAPAPYAWLLAASVLAGIVHAFDLPSGRALLGDLIPPEDLDAAVALNGAGFHLSALAGPAVAFLIAAGPGRPVALLASAVVLGAATLVTHMLPVLPARASDQSPGLALREVGRYLIATPVVLLLLLAETVPSVMNKTIALVIPSMAHGSGTVSLSLIAPEFGALAAAATLAIAPIRLGLRELAAAAGVYGVSITLASGSSGEAVVFVTLLGFAGMAKLMLGAGALARIQEMVPMHLRGRVLAV